MILKVKIKFKKFLFIAGYDLAWIIHESRMPQMRGVDVWSCTHVPQMRRNKADEVLSTRLFEVKNVDYG